MSQPSDIHEQTQRSGPGSGEGLPIGRTVPVQEAETVQQQLPREDIEYLRSEWDEIDISNDEENARIKVNNYVGIIGLPSGASLSIRPKIECNLLYLLAYSGHIDEELVYDAEDAGFTPGDDLEQVLAQLFLAELERVLKRGLQQEYHQQEQTKQHLRGQLRIQRQIERQGRAPTAFECRYSELTHDTPLNQVILAATSQLCSWLSPSQLRSKLLQLRGMLRQRVSETPVSPDILGRITLSHLDRHYRRIVALAELVLTEQFIGGLERPDRPLPSLVFDMPTVFESVTVRALRSVTDSEQYRITEEDLGDFARTDSGDETRSLEPDIVFRDQVQNNTVTAVGDAKWKSDSRPSREDLYQLSAYQTHKGTPGLLVYPDATETKHDTYRYVESTATRGPLLVRTLGVQTTDTEVMEYESYVGRIESNAQTLVDDLFRHL